MKKHVLTMRGDLLVRKLVPADKGILALNDIIIIYSRHCDNLLEIGV